MKIIKLIDGFALIPERDWPLRHFCPSRIPDPGSMREFIPDPGWPLTNLNLKQGICDKCGYKISPKVTAIVKLWSWQNNKEI